MKLFHFSLPDVGCNPNDLSQTDPEPESLRIPANLISIPHLANLAG
jgi:hypothetical protein